MNKLELYQRILQDKSNIRFSDFVKLIEAFGFGHSRTSGSHHIFVHPQVRELLNLQKVGGQVKPYQIRQWLRLVERYNLEMEEQT